MATERVSINSIMIEDVPGALQELLSGLSGTSANVLNLAAFSVGGGKGEAYFVTDKPEAAKEYASSNGLALVEYAGFLLTGSDRVGVGAELTKSIADAGINIVLSTATVVGGKYYVLVVVGKSDSEKAAATLGA